MSSETDTRPPEKTEKGKEGDKSGTKSVTAAEATRGGSEVNPQNLFPTGDSGKGGQQQQERTRPGDTAGPQGSVQSTQRLEGSRAPDSATNYQSSTRPDGGTKESYTVPNYEHDGQRITAKVEANHNPNGSYQSEARDGQGNVISRYQEYNRPQNYNVSDVDGNKTNVTLSNITSTNRYRNHEGQMVTQVQPPQGTTNNPWNEIMVKDGQTYVRNRQVNTSGKEGQTNTSDSHPPAWQRL